MRLVLRLVAKDLKRRIRSPLSVLVPLAFPVLFAGMLALVFGGGGEAVPKVRLLVEDRDGGLLANALKSVFTSQQVGRFFEVRNVKAGEGRGLIEEGEASALLVLPEGLTPDLIDGKPVRLELVRNPAEGILPEIAEQVTLVLVDVLEGGARVLRDPLDRLRPVLEGTGAAPTDATVAALSVEFKRAIEGAGTFVLPPAITLEGAFGSEAEDEEPAESESPIAAIFLFILPGVAVYALFMVGDGAMRDVVTEAQEGTLRRQLAGPVGAGTILFAKVAFTSLLALLALVILSAVGAFFVPRPVDLAAFALVSLAVVLAVSGAAAAIYGFARTERLGATVASVLYLVLAFAGGSFVPLGSLPASLRAVAPVSPFFWGTTAFQKILSDGAGVEDVLANVAILAGLGAVLLATGSWALGRAVRNGRLA
jgi:ABC-2 type transport system permease protein